MKIEEFSVTSYGSSPLYFSQPQKTEGFNLFYGPNEAGKSLLIDALLKMILGEKASFSPRGTRKPVFENLDRVDVNPEGFVRLQVGEESYKFPEQGSLVGIFQNESFSGSELQNCTPPDFRNIFVVRDSNLKFTGTMGSDYYSALQDKLTGLHSKQIKNIREKLQEKGRLTNPTSAADLASRKENNQVGERFEKANNCLERIVTLQSRAKDEGYFQLEEKLQKTKREAGEVKEKIQLLNQARKRSEYVQGKKLLEKLKKTEKQLADYPDITEDDFKRFQRAKNRIEDLEKEEAKNSKKYGKIKQKLEQISEPLEQVEHEKDKLENQIDLINQKIHSRKNRAEEIRTELVKNRTIEKPLEWTIAFLAVGTIISLPLIYFQNTIYGMLYPLFFILPLGGTGLWKVKMIRTRSRYEALLQEINNILADFGCSGESLDGIKENIQKLKDNFKKKEKEYEELKNKKNTLETRKETLENSEKEIDEKIKKQRTTIEQIQEKTGTEDYEEYKKKFRDKNDLENKLGELKSKLQGKFGTEGNDFPREEIEKKLQNLAEFENMAAEVEFDEEKLEQLEAKKDRLEERKIQLEEEYAQLKDQLEEIEKITADILGPEEIETPLCRDLNDLEEIRDKLNNFRENVKTDMQSAL
ncbi:MAG: AAA family ATPase, partial [bacterium]